MKSASEYTPEEIKSLAQRMYFELQTELFRREAANSEAFDKAILTYSTGALALSLGFLKDFAITNSGQHFGLLYWSWLLFVLCIASTSGSFLVGKIGNRIQLIKAEHYFLHREDDAYNKRNIPSLITTGMNWLSGVTFCAAALLTVLFVVQSIEEKTMTTIRISTEDMVNKATEAAYIPHLPTAVTPIAPPTPEGPSRGGPQTPATATSPDALKEPE